MTEAPYAFSPSPKVHIRDSRSLFASLALTAKWTGTPATPGFGPMDTLESTGALLTSARAILSCSVADTESGLFPTPPLPGPVPDAVRGINRLPGFVGPSAGLMGRMR